MCHSFLLQQFHYQWLPSVFFVFFSFFIGMWISSSSVEDHILCFLFFRQTCSYDIILYPVLCPLICDSSSLNKLIMFFFRFFNFISSTGFIFSFLNLLLFSLPTFISFKVFFTCTVIIISPT